MVAPLVLAGAGLAAGGLANSIFGRKKVPSFDPTQVMNTINAGAAKQEGIASQLRPENQKLTDAFRTNITGAEDKATAARKAAGEQYLSQLDPVTSRIVQNQSNALKSNLFGQIPEATQAAREALAATGGLGRGVAAESLAKIPIQAAQQYGQGVQGFQTEALRAQQGAVKDIYSNEAAGIAENLGIDNDTYSKILNSNNDALKQQLQELIDISQRQTSGLVSAQTEGQLGDIASASADQANQDAINQALLGAGGTLLGYGLPGGGTVQNVGTAARRRKTITSAIAGDANA